jgi:hypothetical protein
MLSGYCDCVTLIYVTVFLCVHKAKFAIKGFFHKQERRIFSQRNSGLYLSYFFSLIIFQEICSLVA